MPSSVIGLISGFTAVTRVFPDRNGSNTPLPAFGAPREITTADFHIQWKTTRVSEHEKSIKHETSS
jgi:hypothetical protein